MSKLTAKTSAEPKLRIVMVTGAYYPEVSGAGLQCRALLHAASKGGELKFSVITTAVDRSLPPRSDDNGVAVIRLRAGGIFTVLAHWLPRLLELVREISVADVVHLHGFSRKSYLFILLGRLLGKKIVIKMSSLGEDDPPSVQKSGGLRWLFFRRADLYLAPSAALAAAYRNSSLPAEKLSELPNGVDTVRFYPSDEDERRKLRAKLGLPTDGLALLSLGHFSADKRLDFLAHTWSRLECTSGQVHLWLVGENRPGAYEVDKGVAATVTEAANNPERPGELAAPGRVSNPEDWLRAADIFVLPSVREGMPNALLEAMSCGLACVAARLEGITDSVLICGGDEAAGLLFIPDNSRVLAAAIGSLTGSAELRDLLGGRARRKIESGYSLEAVAEEYRKIIYEITGSS